MKKLISNYLWSITNLDFYRRPNQFNTLYYRKVHVYFPVIGLRTWYGVKACRWQSILRWADGKSWRNGKFIVTGLHKGKVFRQFILK